MAAGKDKAISATLPGDTWQRKQDEANPEGARQAAAKRGWRVREEHL